MSKSNLITIEEVKNRIKEMYEREMEFSQTRSSFQIEKFIGCDEYTPVSRYRHLSHNSYQLLLSLQRDLIQREKLLRKKKKIEEEINFLKNEEKVKEQNLDLDLLEINMSLDEIEISINGKIKELAVFEKLLKDMEEKYGKFTYADFEKEQPEYWKKRLSYQMHEMQLGQITGIGAGNYSAYIKALEEPLSKDSNNVIEKINIGELGNRNALNHLAIEALSGKCPKLLEKVFTKNGDNPQ